MMNRMRCRAGWSHVALTLAFRCAIAVCLSLLPAVAYGQDVIEIPLGKAGGWLTVPVVTAEGDTLPFVFDTAAGFLISAQTARALGLSQERMVRSGGVSGPMELPLAYVPSVTSGGIVVPSGSHPVVPDETLTTDEGEVLAGVIGGPLFEGVNILVDGPGRRLLLRDKDIATGWRGVSLTAPRPLTRSHGHMVARVLLNGTPITAILDTGARDVVVNEAAAAHAQIEITSPSRLLRHRGLGTAIVSERAGVAASIRVGATSLEDVPVVVADLPVFRSYVDAEEGFALLGNPFFLRCAVAIDYRHREVQTCRDPGG